MNTFPLVVVLLCLSVADAVSFTTVYDWPLKNMDYEWPSVANRTQALRDGTFKPEKIEPSCMAVFGDRLFLSLAKAGGIPVTLVTIPTSSVSRPNLAPFPSWEMHISEGCSAIEKVTGLEVDAVGRLWVLDGGSQNCSAKLWIFDLNNNDKLELVHQLPVSWPLHDLVLVETSEGWIAYITRFDKTHIVVFSLKTKQSWTVDTPGIRSFSIAVSPARQEEPRQLYLSEFYPPMLFSISAAALGNGSRTAYPKNIGTWSKKPYRTLVDSTGTMYAAFLDVGFMSTWNTSQPFHEQRFYEIKNVQRLRPVTFAVDSSINAFWMMGIWDKSFRLLKSSRF